MKTMLLGSAIFAAGLAGLFGPVVAKITVPAHASARLAVLPPLLATAQPAVPGDTSLVPGDPVLPAAPVDLTGLSGLSGVLAAAGSVIAMVIGVVVAAAKKVSDSYTSALREQVASLSGQLGEQNEWMATERRERNKHETEMMESISKLRQQIALGQACPYLRDDGSCSRLQSPAAAPHPTQTISVVLPPAPVPATAPAPAVT